MSPIQNSVFVGVLFVQTAFLAAAPGPFRRPGPVSSESISYQVVERDAHHRIVQAVVSMTNEFGESLLLTNSYTELETGMHWKNAEGQWVESQPQVQIQAEGGAVAEQVPHRLYLPGSLYTDAIRCFTSEGKLLVSRPLGLSFFDGQRNILIAELQDGPVGQLSQASNQVLYTNICDDSRLDLLVTVKKSGYESDLVIREQLPDPLDYGLTNLSAVRVQWWTEFFDSPQVSRVRRTLTDGREDESLCFGETRMGQGKAYLNRPDSTWIQIPVTKQWVSIEGRTFLVEEVPYNRIANLLATLPLRTASSKILRGETNGLLAQIPLLPPKREIRQGSRPVQLAKLDYQPGFVIDYDLHGSLTNFTFRADTTYHVTNIVNIYGSVFEGGTVIKFSGGAIYLDDSVEFQTESYRPVFVTVKNDNSIGETISGSSGNPTISPCSLIIPGGTFISNARFTFLENPIDGTAGGLDSYFNNVQFVKCRYPLSLAFSDFHFRNALFAETGTNFYGPGVVTCENVTVHNCAKLNYDYTGTGGQLNLTNTLLVGVTNVDSSWTIVSNSVSRVADDGSVFQTNGAGAHYLVPASPYRDIGTTNIHTNLLTQLRLKTTHPPLMLSNITISFNTNLAPYAQPDTDIPDLGYHYDPIDYAMSSVTVTNATLSVFSGTVISAFGTNGLFLQKGSRLISQGSPLAPNRFVIYQAVQEQPLINADPWTPINSYNLSTPHPTGEFRFTDFVGKSVSGNYHFYSHGDWAYGSLTLRDCRFLGARAIFGGVSASVVTLNNNLFEYCPVDYVYDATITGYNNLHRYGTVYFENYGVNAWTFKDNVFDNCSVSVEALDFVTHSNNAYINTAGHLTPTNVNDVLLTSFAYTNGALGNYYQVSTNLLNVGSRNADAATLYHYTVRTNQVKETNSIVDIGFHYVAVGEDNEPLDSDGGGAADFLEDTDGDGIADSGESNWAVGNGADDNKHFLEPGYLRCEYRVDPWGVDVKDPWTGKHKPRLFWIVSSTQRGAKQLAYQIWVATSPEKLTQSQPDMWDSGRKLTASSPSF
jgi:hypothetical protein